jgi:hypothetical protein
MEVQMRKLYLLTVYKVAVKALDSLGLVFSYY